MWVLKVDEFMVMYPGLTPADVMDMDETCFDWLPVTRLARVKAAKLREASDTGAATFGGGRRGG